MTGKHEYKEALKSLDKDIRICFLYLEGLIEDRFKTALAIQQPPAPKADLSKIESQLDSLRKQIGRLRPKIEAGYKLSQEHDEREKKVQKIITNAEEVFAGMKEHFEGLYRSGYYSEGKRRKIREEGLLDIRKEKV